MIYWKNFKKTVKTFVLASFLFVSTVAFADLVPWKDYETSDAVWSVTTVKVDSNMGDAYLEGLKKTWAAGNETAKELGHIEDYQIFRSNMAESGEFNLLLVVKFADGTDLLPSQKRYDEFMAKWGEKRAKESTEFAQKNYPAMRKITGEYQMRLITLK